MKRETSCGRKIVLARSCSTRSFVGALFFHWCPFDRKRFWLQPLRLFCRPTSQPLDQHSNPWPRPSTRPTSEAQPPSSVAVEAGNKLVFEADLPSAKRRSWSCSSRFRPSQPRFRITDWSKFSFVAALSPLWSMELWVFWLGARHELPFPVFTLLTRGHGLLRD